MSAKHPSSASNGSKPPNPPHIDFKRYQQQCKPIALIMNSFVLRHLLRMYHEFDGDLLLPLVLGECAHHNVIRLIAEAKNSGLDQCYELNNPQNASLQLPCNAFSLSESTGIPRETIRRKLAKLVKMGLLVKGERGEVTLAPDVGKHFYPKFNFEMLQDLLAASSGIQALLENDSNMTPEPLMSESRHDKTLRRKD